MFNEAVLQVNPSGQYDALNLANYALQNSHANPKAIYNVQPYGPRGVIITTVALFLGVSYDLDVANVKATNGDQIDALQYIHLNTHGVASVATVPVPPSISDTVASMPLASLLLGMEADSGLVYKDAAGTMACTVDGDPMSSWTDPISTAFFHAVLAPGFWHTNVFGTKSAVLTGGVPGIACTVIPGSLAGGAFTFYAVLKPTANAAVEAYFANYNGSGFILGGNYPVASGWRFWTNGAPDHEGGVRTAGTPTLLTCSVANASTQEDYQDGVNVGSSASSQPAGAPTTLSIGDFAGFNQGYVGYIGALAWQSGQHAPGSSTYDNMIAYLKAKYGTP